MKILSLSSTPSFIFTLTSNPFPLFNAPNPPLLPFIYVLVFLIKLCLLLSKFIHEVSITSPYNYDLSESTILYVHKFLKNCSYTIQLHLFLVYVVASRTIELNCSNELWTNNIIYVMLILQSSSKWPHCFINI